MVQLQPLQMPVSQTCQQSTTHHLNMLAPVLGLQGHVGAVAVGEGRLVAMLA